MDTTLRCKSLVDLADLDEDIAAVLEIVVSSARHCDWPETQYWIRVAAMIGGPAILRLRRTNVRPARRAEWIALMARARATARELRRNAVELRAMG